MDNLPVALLPKFLELPIESDAELTGLAFVMDLREKGFLGKYRDVLEELRRKKWQYKILFLEADEEVLVQRYSETRRHHPISREKSLIECIREEKKQLLEIKDIADRVIDTSSYTVHELKSVIFEIAERSKRLPSMHIYVTSFGFKYGLPPDADLVIDVRFVKNPFFVAELKALDGENPAVFNFVMDSAETREFIKKYQALLDYLIPLYEKERKAYLTIAIGCTGGRHRSVALAQVIHGHLLKQGKPVELRHRDLERGH